MPTGSDQVRQNKRHKQGAGAIVIGHNAVQLRLLAFQYATILPKDYQEGDFLLKEMRLAYDQIRKDVLK